MGYWIFRHCEHLPRAPGLGHRPGAGRGGPGRRLHRLPLVERRAGQDHHGRHRVTGHRRRPGRPVPPAEPRPVAADHRRAVRDGDRCRSSRRW